VLDDGSSDHTAEIVLGFQADDAHIQLINGEPLPAGWGGKNWACQQLAESTTAEVMLFTDADVTWQPGSLSAVLHAAQEMRADMLTVWPTQQMVTIWERLIVPMMSYTTLAYLPWLGVHNLPFASMAAANGQCLLFTRTAYGQVGGHRAVKASIVEDIALARKTKQHGLRLRMLDGDNLVVCRMYTGWHDVRDGYAKNILAGHLNSPALLLLSTIFHWLVFILPPLWLATGWLFPQWPVLDQPLWPLWPLAMVTLSVGSRLLAAAIARQPLRDAFLLPISVFLITLIAGYALRWHYGHGGPAWKGRRVPAEARGSQKVRP
jgi:chlorobactene glucosyltransferase